VTIGANVTSIGEDAFSGCSSLTAVYFLGNTPSLDSNVFAGDSNVTVYYLAGTTGGREISATSGSSVVLGNPLIQTADGGFGVQNNQFGFNITGTSNIVVVVEACANLANPVWVPVATNTLTGGTNYFSDPQWKNYPRRFYRLRSP